MKYILTGGSSSGKSTILAELKQRGYSVIPEGAIQVIEEGIASMGKDEFTQWRMNNYTEYQGMIVQRQLELEEDVDSDIIFLDRSAIDCYTFCRMKDVEQPDIFYETMNSGLFTYEKVFVLETIYPFPERYETGRTQNYERSVSMGQALAEDYQEFGYEVIWIPMASIDERVKLILSCL